MGLFDLFKKKKPDYKCMIFIIKDLERCAHIKEISNDIKSKNTYYHELAVTNNNALKVYVDCKYNGVHPIELADTIQADYGKMIMIPEPKNGKCLKEGCYTFSLDRFLEKVVSWDTKYIYGASPAMKHILHAVDDKVDVYFVFDDEQIFNDVLSYMRKVIKKHYIDYCVKDGEIK